MKNNKKGFTLVELLAVIVILGIILTIAGTNVVKSIEMARKQEVDKFAKMLTDLGPDVYLNEKQNNGALYTIIKTNSSDFYKIAASKLKTAGYLKNVPKIGKTTCSEAYLCIKYNGGSPEYKAYVKCNGKANVAPNPSCSDFSNNLKSIN